MNTKSLHYTRWLLLGTLKQVQCDGFDCCFLVNGHTELVSASLYKSS
jgi:hypothetical protein